MELRKQTSRFFVFILVVGTLLLLVIHGGAARGTALPIIESAGPMPSLTDDHTLRIATVNLWGISVLGFDWSDHIDERFAAMAERLSTNEEKLDIVLLQEAWKSEARRALLEHAGVIQNFPFRVDIAQQPGGAGLVILSRFPIEMAHFHRFQAQGQCLKIWEGDCIAGKGVLTVRLTLGNYPIWVGNTHLIACYTGPGEPKSVCDKQDPNGDYRWSQIIEARQTTENLVGDDPAIFGGDFNFARTSRYFPAMTGQLIPADSSHTPPKLPAKNSRQGWTDIKDTIVNPNRLDYIWTRPGREFRWHVREKVHQIFTEPVTLNSGEKVPLSDHPALKATLCLVHIDDPGNRCLSFK